MSCFMPCQGTTIHGIHGRRLYSPTALTASQSVLGVALSTHTQAHDRDSNLAIGRRLQYSKLRDLYRVCFLVRHVTVPKLTKRLLVSGAILEPRGYSTHEPAVGRVSIRKVLYIRSLIHSQWGSMT
jgi:hypothetical protein